jgi:tRNA G37 N-methylase Trm5
LYFAGIGYFTLPYLVHSGASLVYACEWNPDAVEALERNLKLNGVEDRCIVLRGDNRQVRKMLVLIAGI